MDMSQAKSLTHIGVKGYVHAMSAKEIVVPESVKEVGELAFGPCIGSALKALDYEGRTACLFSALLPN